MNQEFETLYETYFPRIYAFLYKLTENRDLAEELTQETFYQAFVSERPSIWRIRSSAACRRRAPGGHCRRCRRNTRMW